MRALYEIDAEIMDCVDVETGEIIDVERLETLNMERDKKIEGVALYVKQLRAEADAIKTEEKALAERRKKKENLLTGYAEWLRNVLSGQSFETAKVALSFRKSTAVEISGCEHDFITGLYALGLHDCVKYGAPEIKRGEIKKLLKDGVKIPGAVLVESSNLQIK